MGEVLYTASTLAIVMDGILRFRRVVRVHRASHPTDLSPPRRRTRHRGVCPACALHPSDQVLRLHSFVIGLIHDGGYPKGALEGAIVARNQEHAPLPEGNQLLRPLPTEL